MCIKFQGDWTSTSSKTTLTKNFNLKRDERTDEQTNKQTNELTYRPENIMPLYYHRWGIKIKQEITVPSQEYESCYPFVLCVFQLLILPIY